MFLSEIIPCRFFSFVSHFFSTFGKWWHKLNRASERVDSPKARDRRSAVGAIAKQRPAQWLERRSRSRLPTSSLAPSRHQVCPPHTCTHSWAIGEFDPEWFQSFALSLNYHPSTTDTISHNQWKTGLFLCVLFTLAVSNQSLYIPHCYNHIELYLIMKQWRRHENGHIVKMAF